MTRRAIELLAPAKNADVGIEAIRCGADAVYIGAPRFGARVSAGCSVEDIARLTAFAHRFYAKVYVTLNTVLFDDELHEAEQMVWQLYDAGVDALIVQDMALLEMNLPPIALHASTQCNNRTKEKVQFLSQCGFSQVVLARELSIPEIREISSSTSVPLEGFVHGALCVSYSGQCYMSQAYCGRSANRGACAQMCRLPYTLKDANGKVLLDRRHLLSLKDFNASALLQEMIAAGITSFKIEGRLKDVSYVKNVTAYYRRLLDDIISRDESLCRASSGITTFSFQPLIDKSFSRGFTDYFLKSRNLSMASMLTPKSLGQKLGRVVAQSRNSFVVDTDEILNNGDGLCLVTADEDVIGCRVNRADRQTVYPLQMPKERLLSATVYRNLDVAYEQALNNPNFSSRKIMLAVEIKENETGVEVMLRDENGNSLTRQFTLEALEPAKNAEKMRDSWQSQFKKLGDTDFEATSVSLDMPFSWFVPMSQITAFRRQTIEAFVELRAKNYQRPLRAARCESIVAPESLLDYRANVGNALAKRFYENVGVTIVQPAFEKQHVDGAELMRTRYCLKHELGYCAKQNGGKKRLAEPLEISHGKNCWILDFDCVHCEMIIREMSNR